MHYAESLALQAVRLEVSIGSGCGVSRRAMMRNEWRNDFACLHYAWYGGLKHAEILNTFPLISPLAVVASIYIDSSRQDRLNTSLPVRCQRGRSYPVTGRKSTVAMYWTLWR